MGFLRPKGTTAQIQLNEDESVELLFQRFSLPYISKAKDLGRDFGRAISLITGGGARLTGREVTTHEPDGAMTQVREPSEPESLSQRRAEIDEAIELLSDTLLGERTQRILADLVKNSLRSDPRAEEIVEEVFGEDGDMEVALQLIRGAFQANGKSFGPLGQMVRDIAKPLAERLPDAVRKGLDLEDEETDAETEETATTGSTTSN